MLSLGGARRCGLLLSLVMFLSCASASAQDALRGRTLYAGVCAQCHADPPGSGSVNPLVRTPDEIRSTIARVSPMRNLGATLSDADLADIAAYFVTVLDAPIHVPAFDVTGQWASVMQPWWALYVTQYAQRMLLTGGWLTFDDQGRSIWLYFYEAGAWTASGTYTAQLFRNTGPPFATAPGTDAPPPRALQAGTVTFVFADRETADVTFGLDGTSVRHRIQRVRYPP